MIIDEVYSEINSLTSKIIGFGLSVEENPPLRVKNRITWKNEHEVSRLLRNVSYLDKYAFIVDSQNFNLKLLDGGIIQMQYSFNVKGDHISSHRLAYYPAPKLERYEDAPEDYETKYFGDSEYHDLFSLHDVSTPIRFDYCSSPEYYVDVNHPYSHVHFGEYEKCRIPLVSPLPPNKFLNFILRSFYNTAIVEYCNNVHFDSNIVFENTISANERTHLHFYFEG